MLLLHITIKGNDTCSNMVANSLPIHTPSTPGVWSKGHYFLKVVMLHIILSLKRKEVLTNKQAKTHTTDLWGLVDWSDIEIVQLSIFLFY